MQFCLEITAFLAGGADLPTAFDNAEEIEFCAKSTINVKWAGDPVLLTGEQLMLC